MFTGFYDIRIIKSLYNSLLLLKTTYIDILYLHDIEFVVVVLEALVYLQELVDQGLIRSIG